MEYPNFVALDFETATTGKYPLPCSLGITFVYNGLIRATTSFYIDPETAVAPNLQKIHGISTDMVQGGNTFPDVWKIILPFISDYPIVAHNAFFDINILVNTAHRYHLEVPLLKIFDTMLLCKNHFNMQKYNLPFACAYFELCCKNHHSCGDDSEMCARLFLELQKRLESIEEYKFPESKAAEEKLGFSPMIDYQNVLEKDEMLTEAIVSYDDPDGFSIVGKTFVVTGQIGNYSRSELIELIISLGGIVKTAVSKKTDYLIVGYEDVSLVIDPQKAKSSKIVKAEEIRGNGGKIKILPDEFFLAYISKLT